MIPFPNHDRAHLEAADGWLGLGARRRLPRADSRPKSPA